MLSALICMCNLLFVCASNVTILYVLDTDYVASQDLAADLQQILLPELHVNVISMKNSQCNSSIAPMVMKALQDNGTKFIGVVDGLCPSTANDVVNITYSLSLPQISYTPYSVENILHSANQIDRDSYFHIYPAQDQLGLFMVALFQNFQWSTASIVTQSDFIIFSKAVKQRLMEANIATTHSVEFDQTSDNPNLYTFDTLVLLLTSVNARKFLCQSSLRSGRDRYPYKMIITLNWYEEGWWKETSGNNSSDCNNQSVAKVLNNTLSIRMDISEKEVSCSGYCSAGDFAADAVLSIATAFNSSQNSNGSSTDTVEELDKINITGRTGKIFFQNGTRASQIMSVYQLRTDENGSLNIVKVGVVNENLNFTKETNITILRDHKITVSIHLAVIIIFETLAVLGMGFTIFCLAFNLIFRNRKIVKLTSPYLNYLIILGSLILYITVFFTIPPINSVERPDIYNILFCKLLVSSSIGTALCQGTIQGKMFRVFHIFHNPRPNKKHIKDWYILVYVLLNILFIAIPLTLGWAVPILQNSAMAVVNSEIPQETTDIGTTIVYYSYVCGGHPIFRYVSVLLLTGFQGTVQFITFVLALCIRKITVDVLNDSKYIKAIVIVIFLNLILTSILFLTLQNFPTVQAAITAESIVVVPTLTLSLTFIPKMVSLYKDPKGVDVFSKNTPAPSTITAGTSDTKFKV